MSSQKNVSSGIGSTRHRWLLPVFFFLSWSWAGAALPVAGVLAAITPARVLAKGTWRFK